MELHKYEKDLYLNRESLKAMLSTNYYIQNRTLFDSYVACFKETKAIGRVDKDSANFIALKNAVKYKEKITGKEQCSTADIFGSQKDSTNVRYLRKSIDNALRIFKSTSSRFNINLYNFQKILYNGVTAAVSIDGVEKQMPNTKVDWDSIEVTESDNDKVVLLLVNSDKQFNSIVLIKHSNSFEFYDAKQRTTYAFKNYLTKRTFGNWNSYLERIAQTVYSLYKSNSFYCKVIHNKNNEELTNTENKVKEVVTSASVELSKHGNIKEQSDVKRITAEMLTIADIEEISKLLNDGNKEALEDYLKKAYAQSFIRLADRKVFDVDSGRYSQKLVNHYKKHRKSPRDREYNEKQSRGLLYCYGGVVIDGGNNKLNQTNMEIKLTDEAFKDFLMQTGDSQPTKSDWIRLVQEILYNKSQTPQLFSLDQHAVETYLINRNKKNFTFINNMKQTSISANVIYIPCEYHEYLKMIFKRNENNSMLKRNYTALLNIILYEALSELTGKDYMAC